VDRRATGVTFCRVLVLSKAIFASAVGSNLGLKSECLLSGSLGKALVVGNADGVASNLHTVQRNWLGLSASGLHGICNNSNGNTTILLLDDGNGIRTDVHLKVELGGLDSSRLGDDRVNEDGNTSGELLGLLILTLLLGNGNLIWANSHLKVELLGFSASSLHNHWVDVNGDSIGLRKLLRCLLGNRDFVGSNSHLEVELLSFGASALHNHRVNVNWDTSSLRELLRVLFGNRYFIGTDSHL